MSQSNSRPIQNDFRDLTEICVKRSSQLASADRAYSLVTVALANLGTGIRQLQELGDVPNPDARYHGELIAHVLIQAEHLEYYTNRLMEKSRPNGEQKGGA